MNQKIYEMHADICQTFTSPKRLEILDLLRDGEKTVSELVELTKINQSNLSQHLSVLRQKKIVNARRDGTNIYYRISNPKIIQAFDLIREILYERLAENKKLAKNIKDYI
ncbi:MAG: ArsR/SmtB family transcription factor [Methanosarcinales archaeon]